uniref:Uncharacterized protein n=1 Tax=Cucumis melo TaxID=3656 RepID=A0A9I9E8J4_CUCME
MRYPRQNTTVKRRLRYPPSNDDFSPLFCDTLLLTTVVQPMKTLSSLSIIVVSVHPSLCSSSLSSHDFPRISYFSASISETCNLLASSNLSSSSTWVLLRVLCLPDRLSTIIRHLKLMIRDTLLLKGGTLRIWSYLYNKGQLQLKEAMKLLFLVIMLAFLSQSDYTSSG